MTIVKRSGTGIRTSGILSDGTVSSGVLVKGPIGCFFLFTGFRLLGLCLLTRILSAAIQLYLHSRLNLEVEIIWTVWSGPAFAFGHTDCVIMHTPACPLLLCLV